MSIANDHRILSDEMEIYCLNEEIGAGLPLWLPNGVAIRDELEAFVKALERRAGYQRVVSPHLAKAELYERSGHLKNYRSDMFPSMKWEEANKEAEYFLKPMNCPHHHRIFSSSPRSFRDLPLRFAEYGQVYRFENSGALRGLSRVRGLCQNDAHIYVQKEKVFDEICSVLKMHEECYRILGLKGYRYRLSRRDLNKPDVFEGSDESWEKSEAILREALKKLGLPFFEAEGEAAFYGPKIDVQMKIGSSKEESIASVQLDFISAERFNLKYAASGGGFERPWIVHRAPLGSHERFVALLLEYFEGKFPGWLAPVQLQIIPVSENEASSAHEIANALLHSDIRVRVADGNGSLSKRVLAVHRSRPFAKLVLGRNEVSSGYAKLQLRDQEIDIELNDLSEVMKRLLPKPY